MLPEVTWTGSGPWPEMTSRKWSRAHASSIYVVTKPHLRGATGSIACACATGTFCTTTIVVVPLCMTDRATGNDVTPSGFPWVCVSATGSCSISALVGPFDWKWRYETSPVVTEGHLKRVEGVCACVTGSWCFPHFFRVFWPEMTFFLLFSFFFNFFFFHFFLYQSDYFWSFFSYNIFNK